MPIRARGEDGGVGLALRAVAEDGGDEDATRTVPDADRYGEILDPPGRGREASAV